MIGFEVLGHVSMKPRRSEDAAVRSETVDRASAAAPVPQKAVHGERIKASTPCSLRSEVCAPSVRKLWKTRRRSRQSRQFAKSPRVFPECVGRPQVTSSKDIRDRIGGRWILEDRYAQTSTSRPGSCGCDQRLCHAGLCLRLLQLRVCRLRLFCATRIRLLLLCAEGIWPLLPTALLRRVPRRVLPAAGVGMARWGLSRWGLSRVGLSRLETLVAQRGCERQT
jgi:hypothetical protein